MDPNQTVDVEVAFTPSSLGLLSADLEIASNNPCEPLVVIELDGAGVEVPLTPSEQIAEILAFFDDSVKQGTLEGRGRYSRLAKLRLKAMRHMIKAAGEFIDGQWYGVACCQLRRICKHCDGRRALRYGKCACQAGEVGRCFG